MSLLALNQVPTIRRILAGVLKPAILSENREALEIKAEYEKARMMKECGQLIEEIIKGTISLPTISPSPASRVRAGLPPAVVARIFSSASAKVVITFGRRAGLSTEVAIQIAIFSND